MQPQCQGAKIALHTTLDKIVELRDLNNISQSYDDNNQQMKLYTNKEISHEALPFRLLPDTDMNSTF